MRNWTIIAVSPVWKKIQVQREAVPTYGKTSWLDESLMKPSILVWKVRISAANTEPLLNLFFYQLQIIFSITEYTTALFEIIFNILFFTYLKFGRVDKYFIFLFFLHVCRFYFSFKKWWKYNFTKKSLRW